MRLLSDAFEQFVMLDKSTVADGYGSFTSFYTVGASFNGAAVLDSSIQARVAAVQGVTGLYTITTPRTVTLEYHDVIKRMSDGKIFRVTTDGDDRKTPISATLDMRQVNAEEWTLNGELIVDEQGTGNL